MKNFLLLGFLLLFVSTIFSQGKVEFTPIKTPKKYKTAVDSGRNLVKELMSKEKIPGFSVAVLKDGQFIWSEGFGFADLENHISVTPQTRFRIGSLSKLLTATAIAKLYEEGSVDLDAPIQKYVPSFPKKKI